MNTSENNYTTFEILTAQGSKHLESRHRKLDSRPSWTKPLYQARESSLVPLCLHPAHFMHKSQIYEAFISV